MIRFLNPNLLLFYLIRKISHEKNFVNSCETFVEVTPGLIGRHQVGELLLLVGEHLVEVVLLAQAVHGARKFSIKITISLTNRSFVFQK